MEQDVNFAKLRPVEGAAYNSHANERVSQCHPGTRVELLRQIYEWVDDPCGKCIYWLQGMAGTGKSAISRTVAHELDIKGMLGASFFFKRGEGDRGKATRFFPTITSQLVRKLPSLVPHIRHAIETDNFIADRSMSEQFKKLVLQPLGEVETDPKSPKIVVIVVDALDECDREEEAQSLIGVLPLLRQLTSLRPKVFVTSRPEFPIRLQFDRISGSYQDLALHQVDEHVIHNDISTFLEGELSRTRDDYNRLVPRDRRLSSDWPGQANIQKLADMSVPLFIFAATALRFINDRKLGPPNRQFTKLLEYQTTEMSKLEATYSPVLQQLLVDLTEPAKASIIRNFRDVVGSIVNLATPLSTASLSSLLGMDEGDIYNRLDLLHSVLDIPPSTNAPVKLLHLSFRDFLVDGDKTHEFWVDERATHEKLATHCLDILSDNQRLAEDICGLQMPGTFRKDVDSRKIDSCLPPEVQYACLYWVYHLKRSMAELHDGHRVLEFLQNQFLHWLEALSLIERLSESIGLIDELQSLIKVSRFPTHTLGFAETMV